MFHQEFPPPEALQHAIKCFWYTSREFPDELTDFAVMPDGYAEIIFHFGSGCTVLHKGEWQPLPSPFVMGLLNHPVQLRTKKRFQILGVRCFPWTVFDLLGLPPGKGTVHWIDHPIADVQADLNAILNTGRAEDAISILNDYFLRSHAKLPVDNMLYKAGAAMSAAKGIIPVSQVAEAAHATVRTLERKFKKSSGHTMKDISALMKFEQVRNRLWLYPESNLAGLAVELGYTDQSHLSREFKRYSGSTPAAFARKARTGQKTLSDDFVAFVQNKRGNPSR